MVTTLRTYRLHLQVVKPSTLKNEAMCLSETAASTYLTTSSHNLGDCNLNVRSRSFPLIFFRYFLYFFLLFFCYTLSSTVRFISDFFVLLLSKHLFYEFLYCFYIRFFPQYVIILPTIYIRPPLTS